MTTHHRVLKNMWPPSPDRQQSHSIQSVASAKHQLDGTVPARIMDQRHLHIVAMATCT